MTDGEQARIVPFRFSTSRQERIYNRLSKVGPGPAAFYKDAYGLMTEQPPRESATHLIAHLLREIDSGLRDVLVTASEQPVRKGGDGAHRKSIEAILKVLEISPSHPVAEAWLRFATQDDYGLARRAHRDAVSMPRPVNEQFTELWNEMELILDGVLEKFEEHYVVWISKVEQLAQKATPGPEDAKFLKTQLPNNRVTLGHFFNNLNSPAWLQPLSKEDFFKNPPAPIHDLEKGTVGYSMWPQSKYLARMAQFAPNEVFDIILEIPDTTNFLVHPDLADATLKMPPNLAAKLIPEMKQWIETSDNLGLLPLKLGKLMQVLAESGENDSALALCRLLLAFQGDPSDQGKTHSRRASQPRFDLWRYEQIITKNVPVVVDQIGEPTIGLLCDLLDEAIVLSRPLDRKQHSEDLSRSWCASIEGYIERTVDGKPLLVAAIRYSAEQLTLGDPTVVPKLVKSFRKRRWVIFRRLAHHLLNLHPESDLPAVEQTLMSRGMLDKARNWHEYTLLLRDCFKRLTPENQRPILGWIDKGPSVKRFNKMFVKFYGNAPPAEQVEQYVKAWKKQLVGLISNDLPEEWKTTFAEFITPLTADERLETAPHITGGAWAPDRSPMEAKNLAALSIDEIVEFFKTWKSPGEWMAPSAEGLAGTFTRVVADDPQRFSLAAAKFEGLGPIHINALVQGFEEALRKDSSFEWLPLIGLLKWAAGQSSETRSFPVRQNDAGDTWYWTHISTARLLSSAFDSKTTGVPFVYRTEVWKILEPLILAPPSIETVGETDPVLELATKSDSTQTVSPEPMLAAIRYAYWVKRNIEAKSTDARADRDWFGEMPEVRKVLDGTLERKSGGSDIVHSVFGEELGRLSVLDEKWVAQRLSDIFPNEDRGLCDAAWNAYLFSWRPGDRLFKLLRGQYKVAIRRLGEPQFKARFGQSPDEQLAGHLMWLYWWGKLSLDDELICEFFARASDVIRGHALHFLGYSAYSDKEGPAPDTINRLCILFDGRLMVAKSSMDKEKYRPELAAFGWWFASDEFDLNWSIPTLLDVLRIVGRVEVEHLVVERLAQLTKQSPEECAVCLSLLAEGLDDVLGVYGWETHGRTVLADAMTSGNPKAKATTVALINRLESRGYSGFRDLLESA